MQQQTLEKMTNAFVDKHMKMHASYGGSPNGTGMAQPTKVLNPDDEAAMVERQVLSHQDDKPGKLN